MQGRLSHNAATSRTGMPSMTPWTVQVCFVALAILIKQTAGLQGNCNNAASGTRYVPTIATGGANQVCFDMGVGVCANASSPCCSADLSMFQIDAIPACATSTNIANTTVNGQEVRAATFNSASGVLTVNMSSLGLSTQTAAGKQLCITLSAAIPGNPACQDLASLCVNRGGSCTVAVVNTAGTCCAQVLLPLARAPAPLPATPALGLDPTALGISALGATAPTPVFAPTLNSLAAGRTTVTDPGRAFTAQDVTNAVNVANALYNGGFTASLRKRSLMQYVAQPRFNGGQNSDPRCNYLYCYNMPISTMSWAPYAYGFDIYTEVWVLIIETMFPAYRLPVFNAQANDPARAAAFARALNLTRGATILIESWFLPGADTGGVGFGGSSAGAVLSNVAPYANSDLNPGARRNCRVAVTLFNPSGLYSQGLCNAAYTPAVASLFSPPWVPFQVSSAGWACAVPTRSYMAAVSIQGSGFDVLAMQAGFANNFNAQLAIMNQFNCFCGCTLRFSNPDNCTPNPVTTVIPGICGTPSPPFVSSPPPPSTPPDEPPYYFPPVADEPPPPTP